MSPTTLTPGEPLNGESDEYELPDCDCADNVPHDFGEDDYWTCPKCDAQWSNDE